MKTTNARMASRPLQPVPWAPLAGLEAAAKTAAKKAAVGSVAVGSVAVGSVAVGSVAVGSVTRSARNWDEGREEGGGVAPSEARGPPSTENCGFLR